MTYGPAFPDEKSYGEGLSKVEYAAIHASDGDIEAVIRFWQVDNIPTNRVKARIAHAKLLLEETHS